MGITEKSMELKKLFQRAAILRKITRSRRMVYPETSTSMNQWIIRMPIWDSQLFLHSLSNQDLGFVPVHRVAYTRLHSSWTANGASAVLKQVSMLAVLNLETLVTMWKAIRQVYTRIAVKVRQVKKAAMVVSAVCKPHKANDARWAAILAVGARNYGAFKLKDFKIFKRLGCGDIGTVHLAELIGTRTLL